jgi:diketogulonate reductase-like aldo/keto reductase
VSNFNVEQLQSILKTAKIKPAVNQACPHSPTLPTSMNNVSQIKFHPYNHAEHKLLLEFSAKHGIVTEAYSSLRSAFCFFPTQSPDDAPRYPVPSHRCREALSTFLSLPLLSASARHLHRSYYLGYGAKAS